VATTRNGLWRYQMRDVVEVGGFDPSDGQPLIRFIERRGYVVIASSHHHFSSSNPQCRIPHPCGDGVRRVDSKRYSLNSLHARSCLGVRRRAGRPTISAELRLFCRTRGRARCVFFYRHPFALPIQLWFPGPDPDSSPRKVQEALFTNPGYKFSNDIGRIGMPTIRIVAPRTFRAYREWRLELTGRPMGQIKVSTTTVDVATKEWLAKRVISEVGLPSVSSS
jgi:hypothetical protein